MVPDRTSLFSTFSHKKRCMFLRLGIGHPSYDYLEIIVEIAYMITQIRNRVELPATNKM